MNNAFTFVVLIVAVVICGQLMQTYLKQRSKRSEPDDETEQAIRKIDELEERVQVLERIITENRYDLKKEIDDL